MSGSHNLEPKGHVSLRKIQSNQTGSFFVLAQCSDLDNLETACVTFTFTDGSSTWVSSDMTDQSLCQDGAYNIPNRMKHTLEALTDMLPHSHYVYGIQCQPEQSKMLRVTIEWDNRLNYLNEMTEEGEEVSRQFRELEKEARTRRTHLKSYVESKRAFDTDSMIKAAALLKTKSEKLVSFL